MATKTLNEVNILGTERSALPTELKHVTKASAEQYLTTDPNNKVKDYLVRVTFIESKVKSVVTGITADGRVADSDIDFIGLPCPKYCDPSGGGGIMVTKAPGWGNYPPVDFIIPDVKTQIFIGSYKQADKDALLNQIGAGGLLEIRIKLKAGTGNKAKLALIALNLYGRVMDNDNDLVALAR